MDKTAMSAALTQYAKATCPFRFRHHIVVTTITQGGDIHLNGKRVVRVHPSVILSGAPLSEIVSRVFGVITEKRRMYLKVRQDSIEEAKASIVPNIQYLQRAMSPEDFQNYIEGVIEL